MIVQIPKQFKKIALIGLISGITLASVPVHASQITSRSLLLGSSASGATTTHTLSFTVPSSASVGSIRFDYCTAPYGTCTTPSGLLTTGASLTAQSGAVSFSAVNATNGSPYITRGATAITGPQAVSYTLSGIVNPTASNTEYWVRITTYASTDTTGGSIDDGVVVFNTTNQIVVSGTMPESLVFCVGTSGTDCGNITGTAVNLGVFTPTSTNVGTSVMSASTNAGFGYAITVKGTALASGANTITAMGTQSPNSNACTPTCTSAIGTSQFGTNVRANSVASAGGSFGADVTGLGSAVGLNGYNNTNGFRFFSGDIVASAGAVTKANLFTNSYLVNVGGDQAAGTYTSTMTYICTATF